MDYLPRKGEEQVALEKMVSIATRGAQLAYYIDDGVYENPEDPTEEKKAYVEEIWEAIEFLEVNCGAKISGQLVIEEKWSELASEFGKWANYIAMLYGKEESDYLVNFSTMYDGQEKSFPRNGSRRHIVRHLKILCSRFPVSMTNYFAISTEITKSE